MFKIKFHSVIDVITNSSTEIYSWYDGSVSACREMLEEIFKVFGVEEKVDDIFYIHLSYDYYIYIDYISDNKLENEFENYPNNWSEQNEYVKDFVEQVYSGKISKPKWMDDAENAENYSGRTPSNEFTILTKKPEYKELAKKIEKFLYSPDSEAEYEG